MRKEMGQSTMDAGGSAPVRLDKPEIMKGNFINGEISAVDVRGFSLGRWNL